MIAGLILAGGEARRMGGIDKPLLHLAGCSLLDRIIARLRPQADFLALSANGDASRFAASGLPVLADFEPGMGPLGGVLRGLHWAREAGAGALLTVPGDTPFIPADLAARLRPAPAVACVGERRHHAVALWPTTALGALDDYLNRDDRRSVVGFAGWIAMRAVGFDAAGVDPFFNINTPEDLRLAETLLCAPSPPSPPAG